MGSTEDSSAGGTSSSAQGQLHALMLLECMQQPQLRSEAAAVLMQGIAQGQLGVAEVLLSLMATFTSYIQMQDPMT